MIHELLHALGYIHMHNRPDRDRFVNIAWKNIQPNFFREFAKVNPSIFSNLGTPYDFNSIMHYNSLAFTKNGLRTIIPKDSSYTDVIGQRYGLSEGDIKRINIKYKCNLEKSSYAPPYLKYSSSIHKKPEYNVITKEKPHTFAKFSSSFGTPKSSSNGLPFGAPLGSPQSSSISGIGTSSLNSGKISSTSFGKTISSSSFGGKSAEPDDLDELFNLKK